MDFDGASRKGKVDAVARARAAREQRERVSANLSEQHKAAVASKLQVGARRFLTVLRSRALLRAEWRCPPSPSNGQQLVICLWLLRFFDPLHDGVALCTLCRAVVAGMEQDEPALMFAAAGLRREFALRWVDALRRLLLACARLLGARDEPVQKQALAAGTGGPSGSSKELSGQLSGRFGPVLRLLLLAIDPAAWRLVHKLSASPAGQPAAGALTLMAQSALQGAMAAMVASSSGFVLAMHTQLDPALLGAIIKVATKPLLAGPQPAADVAQSLVFQLLAVPALTSQVSAASLELLRREDAFWALCAESGPALAPRARAALAARPDAALCICGNVLALWPAQRPPAGRALAAARLLQALLECERPTESAVGSSACSTFHPFYGWSRHGPSAGLQLHLEAVRGQLQQLWSPRLQEHLFGEAYVPLATRPADAPLQEATAARLLELASHAQAAAALHVAALRVLAPLRPTALARLAYGSLLLPCLWSLLCRLPSGGGGRATNHKAAGTSAAPTLASGALPRLLEAALHPDNEPLMQPLLLLLHGAVQLLPVLDDKELFAEGHPFRPDELALMSAFCNRVAFRLTWECAEHATAPGCKELREACVRLLTLLFDRDARRAFCAPGAWLIPELSAGQLQSELAQSKPRARALLGSTPWVVGFEHRVNIFRELVWQERRTLPGEDLPDHVKGVRVKIRRAHLLEDGYVQLSGLRPEQLKGTIRIEFVNETGLAEAGIDRTGVFKEFLEDTIARAFDPNRGLFVQTPKQQLCPSPTSELADPHHLRLFEFVGRMLGKSLYEGITLEVPLADFFIAKLLGKHSSLDELPSLDETLFSSLDFVKRYDGNLEEDLCLTFSVDEEAFGQRTAVELRAGGRVTAVTKENRIEYIHLMADYRLNRQLAAQSKAFVDGLHDVVPTGWLRLFSAPELQRLINGDDAPVNVADLRKHTKYYGGYTDFSPTVRDFWSVLQEFSAEDIALLLKFVTSCSKPPLLGFAHMQPPFTIQCVNSDGSELPSALAFLGLGRKETKRLPTASTCFNLLKLPNFRNKKVLREKLLFSIRSGAGFELS